LLRTHNIGCIIAAEEGKLSGILTDRDLVLRVAGEGKSPECTTVREVMTPEPIHIAVYKSLHELTALMYTHRVRRAPEVEGNRQVVCIVTIDDIMVPLGEEISDMGRTVSESFLRKPLAADP
jgi:signal-transduction protein with cAMP-binding, CBS, and nucleotidyltransferase domain